MSRRAKVAWWRFVCRLRGHNLVDVSLHVDNGVVIQRTCTRCVQPFGEPRAYAATRYPKLVA